MKAYTHYLKKDDIEYRWRTLLQIGDSWEICGTVFMKNPGSSINLKANPLPIKEKSLLENLRKFDDTETSLSYEWYEFSIDNTMACVYELFEAYYQAQQKTLDGVIQIFNLFNIRDADLGKALDKSKGAIIDELAYTTDDDIKHIVSPAYIGWGGLWNNQAHREHAEQIFSMVRPKASYLCDGIQNNRYYHPQYLMSYGKNKMDCIIELTRFVKGDYHPKELDSINNLIDIKRIIKAVGVISRIVNGTTLTYEYYCNGTGGFRKRNGTISIGVEYDDEHNYILSILSRGNHPEEFSGMVDGFCNNEGLFKVDNSNRKCYIADAKTGTATIADCVERLLKEIKRYREIDFPA